VKGALQRSIGPLAADLQLELDEVVEAAGKMVSHGGIPAIALTHD
jgi:hypothetical protein